METSINPLIKVTMLSLVLVFGLSCGLASAREEVCVYDQEDYRGDRFCTSDSIRNLKDENWNDDIASIEVDRDMEVILYEDSNFRGRSLRVMEDHDYIGHGLDHAVSSIEIIRPAMTIITRAEVISRMLTIRLMMAGNCSHIATVAPKSAAMSNKQALDVKWASACTIVPRGASEDLLGTSK